MCTHVLPGTPAGVHLRYLLEPGHCCDLPLAAARQVVVQLPQTELSLLPVVLFATPGRWGCFRAALQLDAEEAPAAPGPAPQRGCRLFGAL
jgi:hypothetical protein